MKRGSTKAKREPLAVVVEPVVGSPNSETPRTDALIEERRNLPSPEYGSTDGGWSAEDVAAFMALSKKMERELNLAEARLWIAKQALVACRDWRGGLGIHWPMERAAEALRMIDTSNVRVQATAHGPYGIRL